MPFTGTPTIPNLDYVLTLDTPEFSHFSGNMFFLWGHDENFYEWASAKITWLELTLDWRPTDKLRVNGCYQLQCVGRRTDGSTVDLWRSPRLKMEYQLSRPIFLRLVGEYTTERRDALRDDTRTDAPILIFDPAPTATSARPPSATARSGVISCSPTNPPRDGALRRLRQHPPGPQRAGAVKPAPGGGWVLPQAELSVSDVIGRLCDIGYSLLAIRCAVSGYRVFIKDPPNQLL